MYIYVYDSEYNNNSNNYLFIYLHLHEGDKVTEWVQYNAVMITVLKDT